MPDRQMWCSESSPVYPSLHRNLDSFKVCSYFKDVIQSSIILQYLIKLDMFGYIDALGSMDAPLIPATRLNQLERHVEAWNNLDWMETRLSAPPHDVQDFGIVSQGIFATSDRSGVYCIQLPRPMQGIPLRTWVLGGFAFPITQIEIDPSNNLLVVLSRTFLRPDVHNVALYLHTLSGNHPHPRVRNHILFQFLQTRSTP
ncbi:hypothetical protein BS47DRAFT_1346358 [Hydnum rufescens UP504]|uniref:Uncharacterized protein n=1 Tax=Hydnum rufescens UP504 TaxID=1448309 RepID=A0A9P6ATN7_9AGAM|nr:hypothetical protein BS47DRAFT_1346358 [Hydnum rufescens UP504]